MQSTARQPEGTHPELQRVHAGGRVVRADAEHDAPTASECSVAERETGTRQGRAVHACRPFVGS
eukprot:1659827-Pleurochrysis_carterae.AAC.1